MSARRPHPSVGARVPSETQNKAKIKAIQTGCKSYGEYLTKLIEKDCIDIRLEKAEST